MVIEYDIEYDTVPLTVKGVYYPEEPEIRYSSDGSGYPGCAAEFDIKDVICGQQSVLALLDYQQIKELETLILNTEYGKDY